MVQVWDPSAFAYVSTPKAFGKALQPSELPNGIARFFAPHLATPPAPAALPLPLLHSVLQLLLARLGDLIELFASLECRIRGGSVLVVIEGDADALAAALARATAAPTRVEEGSDDSDDNSVDTTDDEGQAQPHTRVPVELRLIDFAHATSAEGKGPDEGVLKGLETTRSLLRGMLERVAEEMGAAGSAQDP